MASPVIEAKSKNLTFPDAIQKLIDGEKISRIEWDSKKEYAYMPDEPNEDLLIHTKGKDHVFQIRRCDALATDWIVL